ncbi:MAG TPA: hypothetical protein VGM87_24050 [Roseomonas sp.]
MKRLLALHEIAALRGDGLRPDLVALLQSPRPAARMHDGAGSTGERGNIVPLPPRKPLPNAASPHHAARLPSTDT